MAHRLILILLSSQAPPNTGSGLQDPVCGGIASNGQTSARHVEHAVKLYYFLQHQSAMDRFQA